MAKIRMLVEIEKQSTTCTGTALTCTGTGSILEAIPHLFRTYTGTSSVLEDCTAPFPHLYQYRLRKLPRNGGIHHSSYTFSPIILFFIKTNMESL